MPSTPAKKRPRSPAPALPSEASAGVPLHALLEGLPDAFFTLDAGWRFTYLSPRMAELLEGSATVGDDVRRACPQLLDLRRHLRFEQPATQQPATRFEHGWPERDSTFDVRARVVPGGLLVHCRDISGEKRAKEELRRASEVFRAIHEGTTDSVYTKDLEGRYQLINASGARAVGYEVEQMVGRTDHELFAPEVARVNAANDREVLAFGRTVTYEDAQPGVEGPRVWLSTKGVLRDGDGKVVGLFGISRDITQRKWAEEEARRHSEFQEQLMGIVSHDIRSPLGAIMNWSRVMAESGTAEDARRTSQRIATAAVRIERLTRLLLDFTRTRLMGGVAIEPRPMDLKDLALRVAHEFRVAYPERVIEVEHKGNTQGMWDPDRLGQVASNLLENALKFGPSDTPVRLEVRATRGNKVVLEVHNGGRPIPAHLLPHLFEPFRSGPQTTRTLKMSYGLGLYIVREIVQAHGGGIEVSSTEEDGTSFTVTLPRRSLPARPQAQSPRVPRSEPR
ncbi:MULTISPECIES: ATP-binding protein [unclassified Myxococcus]|uniref:PAS domain-containing sensor histidine kinase n=1 Tax=unclassified Myxococcus TaxID=2648731 RepID=UPI001CBB04F6|nr:MULTISPECIES: ATP-binding protein [unclassified Myxococcus]MBZ4398628.1 PAS domain-containing protein [Myxococcus sp. AS-1-15]MBZ4414428.1 PAS domain-containing protein [Myxococcus sp. XM-1-1-1]BDT38158.1 PAS domain-containing protein [Myxococcus sp. MH1]